MSAGYDDLRWKIDEAKRLLPLPHLLEKLGLGEYAKKSVHCPLHDDEHKSFSVFHSEDGKGWQWKCFAGCGEGDEIGFLRKLKGLSMTGAMNLYLSMAGFPARAPHRSHEYPKFPESPKSPEYPEYPEYPVYPVSNGQGLQEELKCLAASNACTERGSARKRRWQLVRDLRAVEERIARQLSNDKLIRVFNEWFRTSQPFLDPEKPRDTYLTKFLAELGKVRVPTGEGETITKALGEVSKLSVSKLPEIPGMADAPESWRRISALHHELSRRCANKTYFLSCRDAAKVYQGLSKSAAADVNRALDRLGVITIVRIGDRRLNGKASKFRYLLPQTENGAPQAENGCHASKDWGGQNADDCDWP
jgi:hypothetical protein